MDPSFGESASFDVAGTCDIGCVTIGDGE
jgi:hypothetical protein